MFESLATLCAALFAGAAIYVNLVEHPARMTLGAAAALAEFAPSYRRATVLQATLAVVGAAAGCIAWALGAPRGWLAGALLLGAVVPFTLLVILPTNRRLLDPAAANDPAGTSRLLGRWNRLHAVRSLLSLAALGTFLALR
jgi:anthrone oxygenase-like protein